MTRLLWSRLALFLALVTLGLLCGYLSYTTGEYRAYDMQLPTLPIGEQP